MSLYDKKVISDLQYELRQQQAEIDDLVEAFSHLYINPHNGTENCKECGLYVDHPVHGKK